MPDEVTIEALQAQLAARDARIKEVNDEAKGHRLNAGEARKEAETLKAAMEAATAAAQAKLAEIEAATADRVKAATTKAVNADLKVAAKDLGAADVADVLALVPRDKLKIDDDGNVTNAAEVLAEMKAAKPYLFGAIKTGSTATPPSNAPATAKRATDMTPEEYKAARAAALSKR